jgi:hypothetical protein
MGCDIHLCAEYRKDGVWHRAFPDDAAKSPWLVEQAARPDDDGWYATRARVTWYDDRNYASFAILANVRNGGGVFSAGQWFEPIAEPRGLPNDMSADVQYVFDRYERDEESNENDHDICPGDHSASWVTLAELERYDANRRTEERGVISYADFCAREDRGESGTQPREWAGAVWQRGGVTITEEEARMRRRYPGLVHSDIPDDKVSVEVRWVHRILDCCPGLFGRLVPGLQRLRDREGVTSDDVRVVFNFDS